MTEEDMRDDQDRIAEFVERQLAVEIWMAEADWLTLMDFLGFLAVRPDSAIAFETA
ncbi:hypothetical protein D3C77_723140 [compost metagenome]